MERRSLRANLVIFGGIDFGKQSKENLQGVYILLERRKPLSLEVKEGYSYDRGM
jgi:hypothetical protein